MGATDVTRDRPDTHVVRVTGMTCAACERRVAAAAGRLDGVRSATADARRGRLVLTGSLPPDAELRAVLDRAGYTLGAPRLLSAEPRVWLEGLAAAAAVVLLAVLAARSGITGWAPDAGLSGPVLALLVGLAAGVSTCMALVGGLVLAVSASSSGTTPSPRVETVRRQLIFTAGRWVAFAAGGAALGALGSAARLPDRVLALGVLAAAVVMALLGLRLTGISPRLSGWSLTLPRRWAGRFGAGSPRPSRSAAALAGAGTFLLPCGFTQAMQLYATSQGAPLPAAITMTAFAVGTTPGLLGLGLVGGLAGRRSGSATAAVGGAGPDAGRAGRRRWPRLVGVLVVGFAVVNAAGGLRALGVGLPWADGVAPALAATTVSSNVRVADGAQVVTLTQSADGYSPADTTVWAGLPIHWTIQVNGGFTCTSFLRVPSLGVAADLPHTGTHVVELPALRVGTTRFTCVMGMYSGVLRAIPRPAGP
jgi:sulfite exporter TauE/SafE/copper chaperone CopZ